MFAKTNYIMENYQFYKESLILLNLSEKTIQSYSKTMEYVSKKLKIPINDITEMDLRKYILTSTGKKLSSATHMAIINSFKSYFKIIHKRKFDHDILPRPKIEQKQPDILSTVEIQSMVNVTHNLKHKSIIVLMYSCALRVSELCNLKIKDIDSKNNKINIRCSKGKIDRVVMLDKKVLEMLRIYYKEYKMKEYLFEGEKGCKYSITSVQTIIKTKAKLAGINKHISSHSMRHSCLTQLIKNGVDLRSIQKIAGHKNINTTANYIKLTDADILETVSPISVININ